MMRLIAFFVLILLVGVYLFYMSEPGKSKDGQTTGSMIESVFDQSSENKDRIDALNQRTEALIGENEGRQRDRLNSY